MATKRKTLPKVVDELIKTKDIDALIDILSDCQIEAYNTYNQNTIISYRDIPEDIIRWYVEHGGDVNYVGRWKRTPLDYHATYFNSSVALLIELGADIAVRDYMGDTPLHSAATSFKLENVKLLLDAGADITAVNGGNATPLYAMLRGVRNIDLEAAYDIAKYLLEQGDKATEDMRKEVTRIGTDFEFYRNQINPDFIESMECALNGLYQLFDVEPVPKRIMNDGTTKIVVKGTKWQDQHQELWELLVPGQGHASTLQGEAVRITGKVTRELLDNGGVNWDGEYRKMCDAFLDYFSKGKCKEKILSELTNLIKEIKKRNVDKDELYRWTQMAVEWVLDNPDPITLKQVNYRR